jgi:hypothetical protein
VHELARPQVTGGPDGEPEAAEHGGHRMGEGSQGRQ